MWDIFWHKILGRPYQLSKTIDIGSGQIVVLLHGIGRTGHVWQHVVEQLATLPYRVVAFDLLGFGQSPKPTWPIYSVDDHAKAVITSLNALRPTKPVIIVGHSMGALVAARVARLQPKLAKHMVLYEMPLYEGLPKKRMYQLRLAMYRKLYDSIASYQPTFATGQTPLSERLAIGIIGFEAAPESWQPYVKSLQNTIVRQTAAEDIKRLNMPVDVIYGLYDMLVIRGKPQQTFGQDNFITTHTVRARHVISKRASRFIVERIEHAEHPEQETNRKARKVLEHAKRLRRIKPAR